MGFDASKEAISGSKAYYIILASDISAKTEKEIRFFAGKSDIPVSKTGITLDEFSLGLGKKTGILTICNKGFADKMSELLTSNFESQLN